MYTINGILKPVSGTQPLLATCWGHGGPPFEMHPAKNQQPRSTKEKYYNMDLLCYRYSSD